MSKYAEVSYTGNGATTQFVVSFPYIEKSHVSVYLDDVLTTAYTWNDGVTIIMDSAPSSGVVVKIKRESSINTRLTDYNDGSKLVEKDLDDDSEQALYLIQETRDLVTDAGSNVTVLEGRVDTAESEIDTLQSSLSTAESDIDTLQTDVAANTSDISDNAIAIAANAANISSNDSDIATNASNIATNVSDISDLDARLTTAESDIDDNTADIISGDAATLAAARAYTDAVYGAGLSPWSNSQDYDLGDIIYYTDNIIYKCITSHTANESFTPAYWVEISRTLTDAEVKVAYENNANTNAFTDALLSKLNSIESSATADQTGAEIKALYEAESDTNAFTDAEKSKLSGIESGATADQTGAEIKALYEAETNTNAFTDTLLSKLNGIEEGATVGGSGGGIDAWADATAYEVDDVVFYTDNKIYKCTIAHTSSGTLNGSNFQELSAGSSYTAADIKSLYESNADTNAFTNADNAKLDSIEDSATADQTPSEIKIAYESNADTNAFTDAEQTKLAGLSTTYTNAEATPTTIGGIPAGTTFSNVELSQIIEDLLYPYQTPAFSYFRVNGASSVTLGVGETFSGSNLVFTWATTNSGNVQANSIVLNGTSGLANDGAETQTVADKTETTQASDSFTIQGTDSNSDTFSRTITLNWRHRRYFGVSANTSLNDAEVKALSSEYSTNHTKSVEYDGAGGRYFYFAFPQSFGALTNTTINSLSWNDWVLETRNVVNEHGVSVPYYIYRSFNLINGTITVDWS
jgi:hypothetical protein